MFCYITCFMLCYITYVMLYYITNVMLCYITCMHVMLSNMCYNIKYVVIT